MANANVSGSCVVCWVCLAPHLTPTLLYSVAAFDRPRFQLRAGPDMLTLCFHRHMTLLFCIFRYSLSYITFNYYSGWARFSYRTAFISAAVTYGIVVYKAFRARARAVARGGAPVSLSSIMTDENIRENIQYLGMCPLFSGILDSSAADNRSHGAGLALFSTVPPRHAPLWRLLRLPRRYLYPHQPDPDPPTPSSGGRLSQRQAQVQCHRRYDWQVRQGVL